MNPLLAISCLFFLPVPVLAADYPLGRKNWTFLGSDRGGRTAAVLYSLTGTCKHHGIDPFAFLDDVLRRLPPQPAGRLDELLPDAWFASHPAARRKTAA
jgi:hypothetical protein